MPPILRRMKKVPKPSPRVESYNLSLTAQEMNAVQFALAYVIISDRRRTDEEVHDDHRIHNVFNDCNDLSQRLARLTSPRKVRHQ